MNTKSPLITVGIPVYNGEKFLREAIESVLAQTEQSWELIVTDDASIDESVRVAQGYRDERIKVLTDREHRGISYRLNQQVALAKGKYFARMDADDVMMPDRLAVQFDFLRSHPEIDLVGSSAYTRKSEFYSGILRVKNGFIHPTIMGKTQWFQEHPYRTECDGCEDWDLWLRTKNQSSFANLEQPLMYYRIPEYPDVLKYLERRRIGRKVIRMDQKYLPLLKYYYLLFDSHMKSMLVKGMNLINFNFLNFLK